MKKRLFVILILAFAFLYIGNQAEAGKYCPCYCYYDNGFDWAHDCSGVSECDCCSTCPDIYPIGRSDSKYTGSCQALICYDAPDPEPSAEDTESVPLNPEPEPQPSTSQGQSSLPTFRGLRGTAVGIGYDISQGSRDIPSVVGTVISLIIALVGVIFMVLIWLGAFQIVGAAGNEEQFKKGKNMIKNGAIGIAIVFAAYLFARLILTIVTQGVFLG